MAIIDTSHVCSLCALSCRDTRSVEEERIVRHSMLLFRNLLAIKDNEDIITASRVQVFTAAFTYTACYSID